MQKCGCTHKSMTKSQTVTIEKASQKMHKLLRVPQNNKKGNQCHKRKMIS